MYPVISSISLAVAPLVGAWIETYRARCRKHSGQSLPSWERGLKHVTRNLIDFAGIRSLPSWERGLKPESHALLSKAFPVAPLVGAWIETAGSKGFPTLSGVAPLVGAWIETLYVVRHTNHSHVAPLVGAWIETGNRLTFVMVRNGRSPRGSVD